MVSFGLIHLQGFVILHSFGQTWSLWLSQSSSLVSVSIFLFTSYLFVVLYWAGAVHQVSAQSFRKGALFISKTKPAFFIVDSVWLVFELTTRFLYGTGWFNETYDTVYNVFLAMMSLLFSLGFLIYGSILITRLKGSTAIFKDEDNKIQQLTQITVVVAATFFTAALTIILIEILGGLNTPLGIIISYSVGYCIELILCIEILYAIRPVYKFKVQGIAKVDQKLQLESTPSDT